MRYHTRLKPATDPLLVRAFGQSSGHHVVQAFWRQRDFRYRVSYIVSAFSWSCALLYSRREHHPVRCRIHLDQPPRTLIDSVLFRRTFEWYFHDARLPRLFTIVDRDRATAYRIHYSRTSSAFSGDFSQFYKIPNNHTPQLTPLREAGQASSPQERFNTQG